MDNPNNLQIINENLLKATFWGGFDKIEVWIVAKYDFLDYAK